MSDPCTVEPHLPQFTVQYIYTEDAVVVAVLDALVELPTV
jgi:hypothetical protein